MWSGHAASLIVQTAFLLTILLTDYITPPINTRPQCNTRNTTADGAALAVWRRWPIRTSREAIALPEGEHLWRGAEAIAQHRNALLLLSRDNVLQQSATVTLPLQLRMNGNAPRVIRAVAGTAAVLPAPRVFAPVNARAGGVARR